MSAGLIIVSGYLIYRYIQYGESETAAYTGRERETGMAEEECNTRKDSAGRNILVRILTTGYESRHHEAVTLTCSSAYTVYQLGEEEFETQSEAGGSAGSQELMQLAPGEQFCIQSSDLQENTVLCVAARRDVPITVTSIVRGDGAPRYGGKLYLAGEEGGIALYNELPLEEYLCSVVSSEMPSDYPVEAQKAQAVCARTYAQNCMRRKKTGAMQEDLDDSVEFQVYNNYRSSDVSENAVEATAGQTLPLDEVLYYSTDCLSKDRDDLGSDEAFARFLSEEPQEDAEYDSPWLRWEVTLTQEQLLENVRKQYEFEDEAVQSAGITKREDDGQAVQLVLCGEERTVTVDGEYAVRRVLSPGQGAVSLRDGSTVSGMTMLPSAYFTVRAVSTDGEDESGPAPDFVLSGGGYGHGIGMSQCGAAQMAVRGADYRKILEYYYGCSVIG